MTPRTCRVLLVEDDARLCGALSRVLRNCDVTVAHDGREALARFEAGQRFDVVLCDWMMPSMGGAALIERLRALDPAQAQRLIVVTGDPCALGHASGNGLFVVGKPFDVPELAALVDRIAAAAHAGYFPKTRETRAV